MDKVRMFFKNLTIGGKLLLVLAIAGSIFGIKLGADKWIPKSIKKSAEIKAKVDMPPLAYDKDANAPVRPTPEFNEPSDKAEVTANKEIRGALMGWNGQIGLMYGVGGKTTSKGSIAEELNLNIKLDVQNSCTEQANQLYAFVEDYAGGASNPTKGIHFTGWMGDAAASYLSGLNARIIKAFGPEYIFKVMDFGGASFGEDKWLLKPKFKKDPRGSLTVTVLRDGDWNICMLYAKQKGIKVNPDLTTWDPDALNFMSAPNDDYMESAKSYIAGAKVKRIIVRNGKQMGDTLIGPDGFSSWFPADYQGVKEKGGVITVASTKDYGAQMPASFLFCDKWAKENKDLMINFCAMVGLAGDQVKSHDDALKFGAEVSQLVYADANMSVDDWYNAYKSFPYTDDMGNETEVGGSRVFNLADAANYAGVIGTGKYKAVYETFGGIVLEYYPEIVKSIFPYEEATDFTYLSVAYNNNKSKAGNISKPSFTKGDRITETFASRSYAINFATGSSTILPTSYKVLDEVAKQLTISDNLQAELSGHTDNTGIDENNLVLSKERADAVLAYLVKKNPELADQLTAYGYGSKRPVNPTEDQNTKAARDANRRVELKLGR